MSKGLANYGFSEFKEHRCQPANEDTIITKGTEGYSLFSAIIIVVHRARHLNSYQAGQHQVEINRVFLIDTIKIYRHFLGLAKLRNHTLARTIHETPARPGA